MIAEKSEALELAERYVPYFMADEQEPFLIKAVGYSVFKKDSHSLSCRRELIVNPRICKCVIEYAVFFDFDIGHLYDLEHVFVYVGLEDEVIDVEGSFHGKFLKAKVNEKLVLEEETHPRIYMQPGKHAMTSAPEYFNLYIGLREDCNSDAGKDGLLIAPMFEGRLYTSPLINQMVKDYIKEHYAFEPSLRFQPVGDVTDKLMPYAQLETYIVKEIKCWQYKIMNND